MSSRSATALIAVILLFAPAAVARSSATFNRALLTFYWTIDENAACYRGGSPAVLRDTRGNVIAHTTSRFRRAVTREGAGTLRDGRVVVYVRRLHGEHRFRVVKRPITVTGCNLVPFRSVAVDPRLIKLGSKLYIPQLKGARLPDGTIHDGIFVAADCGSFRGRRIDLFVGDGPHCARPFIRRGYGSRSHVKVYLVADSSSTASRSSLNSP